MWFPVLLTALGSGVLALAVRLLDRPHFRGDPGTLVLRHSPVFLWTGEVGLLFFALLAWFASRPGARGGADALPLAAGLAALGAVTALLSVAQSARLDEDGLEARLFGIRTVRLPWNAIREVEFRMSAQVLRVRGGTGQVGLGTSLAPFSEACARILRNLPVTAELQGRASIVLLAGSGIEDSELATCYGRRWLSDPEVGLLHAAAGYAADMLRARGRFEPFALWLEPQGQRHLVPDEGRTEAALAPALARGEIALAVLASLDRSSFVPELRLDVRTPGAREILQCEWDAMADTFSVPGHAANSSEGEVLEPPKIPG